MWRLPRRCVLSIWQFGTLRCRYGAMCRCDIVTTFSFTVFPLLLPRRVKYVPRITIVCDMVLRLCVVNPTLRQVQQPDQSNVQCCLPHVPFGYGALCVWMLLPVLWLGLDGCMWVGTAFLRRISTFHCVVLTFQYPSCPHTQARTVLLGPMPPSAVQREHTKP